MIDGAYEMHLSNLKKLHVDLEKQMMKFDEIIPYERQATSRIYSPRLLNLMLACCPQIEAIIKLISHRCGFPNCSQIPKMIQKINEKGVLSNFQIISIPHKLQFTPFTKELSWWKAYNNLKHELTEKQFELTYAKIMDALAALAILHCLAKHLNTDNDEWVQRILDHNAWTNNEKELRIYKTNGINRYNEEHRSTCKSLIFEVTTIIRQFTDV